MLFVMTLGIVENLWFYILPRVYAFNGHSAYLDIYAFIDVG